MRLDLNDILAVLISLRGYGLAHTKYALKNPLDHGARVPTGGLGGERATGMSSWRGATLEEPT
jgi:hypothetical protein